MSRRPLRSSDTQRDPDSQQDPDLVPSQLLIGILLVLLSTIFLAAQNVISRLFFVPSDVFEQFTVGGWLTPLLSNITMLLALRMGMMALLLAVAAPFLYGKTFAAIAQLPKRPRVMGCVMGSGGCLFVGLIALYFALSQVAAGIAIATFFIYPAVTVLLAWRFLQQRPQRRQLTLMLIILFGVMLTTLNSVATLSANPLLGTVSGLFAGLNFGLYGIFAEIVLQSHPSKPSLHPVPFSLITFAIVSALSALVLPFMLPIEVYPSAWQPILWMTLLSATVTVAAYVLNNSGIRLIGASLTALISATAPALTALFAWIALQEALQPQQSLGVAVVTVGVAALSLSAKKRS